MHVHFISTVDLNSDGLGEGLYNVNGSGIEFLPLSLTMMVWAFGCVAQRRASGGVS
jgi:hypothetical protein